jgi:hypothetical protein
VQDSRRLSSELFESATLGVFWDLDSVVLAMTSINLMAWAVEVKHGKRAAI